jgi:hypothetical protein
MESHTTFGSTEVSPSLKLSILVTPSPTGTQLPPLQEEHHSYKVVSPFAKTYHRQTPTTLVPPPSDTPLKSHFPITLLKGTRSFTSHPITHFVSNDLYFLIVILESFPKYYLDAFTLPL